MIHLILGGARSGKTRFATQAATELSAQGYECVYLATAQALDDEMRDRIARHQVDRAQDTVQWQSFETPFTLVDTLREIARDDRVIVIDCLTLWLTNHLLIEPQSEVDERWKAVKQSLLHALPTLAGEIYLVSNEVGCGIVPLGELSRRFVDEAGWLHQDIASIADEVVLVTAGLPMRLKGSERGNARQV